MKYTVILKAKRLYWNENGECIAIPGSKVARVDSLIDAKIAVRKYIIDTNIGASSYTGGDVLDSDNNVVAHVSYNGRVWKNRNSDELIDVTKEV